jgi:hypothetical protein
MTLRDYLRRKLAESRAAAAWAKPPICFNCGHCPACVRLRGQIAEARRNAQWHEDGSATLFGRPYHSVRGE